MNEISGEIVEMSKEDGRFFLTIEVDKNDVYSKEHNPLYKKVNISFEKE